MGRILNSADFEYIPPPASSGPRTLDASQFEEADDKPEKEAPGLLEAGFRGVKQGVTFGFGDEISGALESAFSDKAYRQARDEARANDKAAREEHPWGFGLGEVIGGVATSAVPGVGLAKLGTGAAAAAARGAAAGIATGAGDSESEGLTGVVQDAAKGGLVGGTLGGIIGGAASKFVKGAPERADKMLLSEIGDRATPTIRAKLAAKETSVLGTARYFGLDKVARDPEALKAATDAAKKEVGQGIGAIYQEADQVSAGVPLSKVMRALHQVEQEYRSNPATKPLADSIAKQIEDVRTTWGQYPAIKQVPHVPAEEVRQFATELGDKGFAGAVLDPKVSKLMQRKTWGAVKDILDEHVASVVPHAAPELHALNKQYSALSNIGQAAAKRSSLASFSPTGLRQIAGEGVNVASMAASLASGSPLPYLATKVGIPAAKAAHRQATLLLSKIVRASRAGDVPSGLIEEALAAGVPRGAIEMSLGMNRRGEVYEEDQQP